MPLPKMFTRINEPSTKAISYFVQQVKLEFYIFELYPFKM